MGFFGKDVCIQFYKITSIITSKLGFYYCYDSYVKQYKRFTKCAIVKGYYQSENYFIKIKEEIKNEIRISVEVTEKESNWIDKMNNTNSVCVHIRRGDYLKFAEVHLVCDTDYYIKAVDKIKKLIIKPTFYILSDDVKWCKENIDFGTDVNYIDDINIDYKELRLMYNCKHFIISNSSFSWWGQYLSDSKNKVVIAPSRWFNNDIKTDIFMDDWILMDV